MNMIAITIIEEWICYKMLFEVDRMNKVHLSVFMEFWQ